MRISNSQLELYNECPLKWHFRYIDKIETPKSEALLLGSEFHYNIEHKILINSKAGRMVFYLYNNSEFRNYLSGAKFEVKKELKIDGLNFIVIYDALGKDCILEFKSASRAWKDKRFDEEFQPHIYLKAEYKRTGIWKEFIYFIVNKNDYSIQVKKVKFNPEKWREIKKIANRLFNDWEFKPKKNQYCYFCDFKNNCYLNF